MQIHPDHQHIVDAARAYALGPKGRVRDTDYISGRLVMASAAGWYVGNVCWCAITYGEESEMDFDNDLMLEPYSRDTQYMTKETAMDYYNSDIDMPI